MLPLIVSFYTNDWEYPAHAERLKRECEALGLEYRVERRDSAGGYIQNTCIKPFFIREMMLSEKRPLLWVDVDGSILKRPIFFDNLNLDFAAKHMTNARKRVWHVGTMFFNYTVAALKLLDRWCSMSGTLTDESALEEAWRGLNNISYTDIPANYFEVATGQYRPTSETVICHRLSKSPSKQQQRHLFVGDRPQ